MRNRGWLLTLFIACLACTRQPRLSPTSPHNVTGLLNDSTWFGTGQAIWLFTPTGPPGSVKQFNLQIVTDIDFPGNASVNRSPVVTGCLTDCVPTQRLNIYHIPLRKGKYKLAKLAKRRTGENGLLATDQRQWYL